MEDNPTNYDEKQFLLPALSPVANLGCLPGSFKVRCSHHDFQKENIQKIVCLKKASGPKLSTLGNVRPLKRHVTAPPSHAWPCPGRGWALPCCYALNKTKPSSWKQTLESHSDPFASLMRMFKTCWRFVQAERVGYISVGVAAAAPVMVWSCKISNSLLQHCKVTECACSA